MTAYFQLFKGLGKTQVPNQEQACLLSLSILYVIQKVMN